MTVYLDLDGPLLDVSRRYHAVYRSIIGLLGGPALPFGRYWDLKRSGLRDAEICRLVHPEVDPDAYERLFRERIERRSYLRLDAPAPGALRALRALRRRHRSVLATLRRHGAPMREQLDRMGLAPLLSGALQREGNGGAWIEKAEMIAAEPGFRRREAVLVGDTESDARAAARLGIPCLLVCNGLRSRDVLAGWRPAGLLQSAAEIPFRLPALAAAAAG